MEEGKQENSKRNQKKIIAITLLVIICVIGVSYAYWRLSLSQTETNEIASSCFNITLENEQNAINLQKAYPILDEEGKTLTPYSFTIKNNCDAMASYTVNLELLETVLESDRISSNFVKLMLDENQPLLLTANKSVEKTLENAYEAYELATGYLEANESVTYNLRLWIDGDVTIEDDVMNKQLESKITITASYIDHVPDFCEMNPDSATCTILAQVETEELAYDETVDNNLRYIGANPNNYIDIGDRYGENTFVGKWIELGFPVETVEECNAMAETYDGKNSVLSIIGVSSAEELKSKYCVLEDRSNQPILWRIIGVMNNVDDGTGKKETRLKIIRDEPIGPYSWDNKATSLDDQVNDWNNSFLKDVLNEGAYWSRTTGTCPRGEEGAGTTVPCDFTKSGLSEAAKNAIGDTVWNLGTTNFFENARTASDAYSAERSENVPDGNQTTWTGKIGLMYPSDYSYATNGTDPTNRATCLEGIDGWRYMEECTTNDWLNQLGVYSWTLAPNMDNDLIMVAAIDYFGQLSQTFGTSYYANMEIGEEDGTWYEYNPYFVANPTAYLKSNTRIISGTGEKSNPYVIQV